MFPFAGRTLENSSGFLTQVGCDVSKCLLNLFGCRLSEFSDIKRRRVSLHVLPHSLWPQEQDIRRHIFLTCMWQMINVTVAQLCLVCFWSVACFSFHSCNIFLHIANRDSLYLNVKSPWKHILFLLFTPKWVGVVRHQNNSSACYMDLDQRARKFSLECKRKGEMQTVCSSSWNQWHFANDAASKSLVSIVF